MATGGKNLSADVVTESAKVGVRAMATHCGIEHLFSTKLRTSFEPELPARNGATKTEPNVYAKETSENKSIHTVGG